jgi:hypothetical protein
LGCLLGPHLTAHLYERLYKRFVRHFRKKKEDKKALLKEVASELKNELASWDFVLKDHPQLNEDIKWSDGKKIIGSRLKGLQLQDILKGVINDLADHVTKVLTRSVADSKDEASASQLAAEAAATTMEAVEAAECRFDYSKGYCRWRYPDGTWGSRCYFNCRR